MTVYFHRRALRAVAALTCALLAACGGTDPEKLLISAKAYLDKGEPRSAAIELKTALQKTPDSAEARYLLGKALLANEEPAAAVLELRKALELKYPRELVVPELARALFELAQNKEIVAQFADTMLENRLAQANLKTTVAMAQARLGAGPAATLALQQALAAVPDHVPAQNAVARLLAVNGDREAATKATQEIIAAGRGDAETFVLQGDLLVFVSNDKDGAIAAYRKALALTKNHLPAHAGILQLQIATQDVKGASEQVEAMKGVRPGNVITRYFEAQLAHLKKDDKTARELVLQLLKSAPDHPQLNQLAGAIELSSGSAVTARSYLNKALQAAPGNATARRMLASTYLRSGESAKALELLQPLLADNSLDSNAMAIAGEAHMQAGDLDKAAALFTQAAKANPGNVASLTALARTRFLKGDAAGAVADLQQIAAADTGGTVADLELITTQMRRRDYQGALMATDGLERKMSGKPLSLQLRGAAYLGLRDTANARASFERALALDSAYFPAAANLAALDMADKKPQAAQQRFETILKAEPGHLRAMLALAELRARSGAAKPEVTEMLANAVRRNPSEATAHLALVNNLLANKQFEAAVAAAQQADASLPAQPTILDALGRAQHAAGQPNQALATFNKIIALQPGNPSAYLRIADLKHATKDDDAAADTLRRAQAAAPDAVIPVQRLIALEVQRGRFAEALKAARDVQKRQPAHSLGFVFEGDTLRAQKNDAAALAAYRLGLAKTGGEIAAPRVHSVMLAMGKKADADQFAAAWTKDHGPDVGFAVYLGDSALARGDFNAAEAAYRRVAEREPNHVAALNNIAWLMVRAGKAGALTFAEKANELQPNQPALMDTLAMALAADKRVDQAIELQKKALLLAPDRNSLRLNLARFHIQAQQRPEARELLEALDKLGDKLPERAEVKALLASL